MTPTTKEYDAWRDVIQLAQSLKLLEETSPQLLRADLNALEECHALLAGVIERVRGGMK
jgi:hypothetical protein